MSGTGVLPRPSVPPILGARAGWMWPGHHLIVQSWEGRLAVVCLIGAEGIKPADSAADWEVIDRPRAAGITEWQGRHNKRLEADLIIEGWVTRDDGGRWIEDHIATLEEMLDTPLTVRLVGPIPFWGLRWAIEHIEYGKEIRDIVTGRRMRQHVVVRFVEYIQPEDLAKLPRAAAAPAQTRQYTIVKGDDLQKIAQKTLGKAGRWKDIEKLNPGMRGIKLDAKKFAPGKKIKVPPK
jgi:hypothetical protein